MKSIVYKGTYICSIDVEDNKEIDEDTAWILFWEEFGPWSIYPKDFDDNNTIAEINDISNLIGLCPNHHWEYDNGLLDLNFYIDAD